MDNRYYVKTFMYSRLRPSAVEICDNVKRSVIRIKENGTFEYQTTCVYPINDQLIGGYPSIPEDAVNKIIAQSRLLSSTLIPYMRKDQFILITPFNDEKGLNGTTYQLVQSNDDIISIYWHNDMSLANWSHFYGETVIHSYDVTLSKRITNVLETYKKIFNELVEKYAHR